MGPADLSEALAPLARHADPRLLVGPDTFDDAAVYRLHDGLALVQTVDFFAPIVDDPYDFGRIAAANALSDVYAMGGQPITALALAAFPEKTLPMSVLTDILRGGEDVVRAAGALVVGGHTVTDEEVKYGLSVTGTVDPAHLITNAGAEPGDVLVLTKPLGTGLLATRLKRGELSATHADGLIASMTTLNAEAAKAAGALGVRAGTDVTGFGLLGHAGHIARASNVTVRINAIALPMLAGVDEALAAGTSMGGLGRNARYADAFTAWGSNVTDSQRALCADPQTSGGLLLAIPADRVADYLARVPAAVVVGDIRPRGASLLAVD